MAKHSADLGDFGAAVQELFCKRVADQITAATNRDGPQAIGEVSFQETSNPFSRQRFNRGVCRQEHMVMRGLLGTDRQVVSKSLCDNGHKRHFLVAAVFSGSQKERGVVEIDVGKFEIGHLAAPQAIRREENDDGVIPFPRGRGAVYFLKKGLHLSPGNVLRTTVSAETAGRDQSRSQVMRDDLLQQEITEEGSENADVAAQSMGAKAFRKVNGEGIEMRDRDILNTADSPAAEEQAKQDKQVAMAMKGRGLKSLVARTELKIIVDQRVGYGTAPRWAGMRSETTSTLLKGVDQKSLNGRRHDRPTFQAERTSVLLSKEDGFGPNEGFEMSRFDVGQSFHSSGNEELMKLSREMKKKSKGCAGVPLVQLAREVVLEERSEQRELIPGHIIRRLQEPPDGAAIGMKTTCNVDPIDRNFVAGIMGYELFEPRVSKEVPEIDKRVPNGLPLDKARSAKSQILVDHFRRQVRERSRFIRKPAQENGRLFHVGPRIPYAPFFEVAFVANQMFVHHGGILIGGNAPAY